MARVQKLDAEDRAAFRLGDNLRHPVRIELAPAEAPGGVTPMLWLTGAAAIDASHALAGAKPALDYYVVPNATIASRGGQPRMGESYIAAPTVFPHYVAHFIDIEEPTQSPFWTAPPNTKALRLKAGISVIHYNLVFGHWLVEMFPKLLMLKSMLPHLRGAPIVLPANAPAYVHDTIRTVLGRWPVFTYDAEQEHVEVEALILPSMFHDAYFFHSAFTACIDEHVQWAEQTIRRRRWFNLAASKTPPPARLFVSRRHVVSSFRALTNIDALEAVAADMGFEIISPERMTWAEQVLAFSRASVIAGEFGSGMHNTLFSPEGARVVCLNWMIDTQSRIANFRRQRVGYVLPASGEPHLYRLGGDFLEYEMEPERFRQALEVALAAGD